MKSYCDIGISPPDNLIDIDNALTQHGFKREERLVVSITFVQQDGRRQQIAAEPGETLMANAKAKGIDGIEAECGGSMVCGTCHVYLEPRVFELLGPPPPMEADMLEYVIAPQATSRLSCQIRVGSDMDGMEVGLPPSQR
jgi:2Fe-2S ferredoxin